MAKSGKKLNYKQGEFVKNIVGGEKFKNWYFGTINDKRVPLTKNQIKKKVDHRENYNNSVKDRVRRALENDPTLNGKLKKTLPFNIKKEDSPGLNYIEVDNSKIFDKDNYEKIKSTKDKISKKNVALGTAAGALVGWGGTRLATSFGDEAKERRRLKAKETLGTLTPKEEDRLRKLKRKRIAIQALGTGVGAVGGGLITHKLEKDKVNKANKTAEDATERNKLEALHKHDKSRIEEEHRVATHNRKVNEKHNDYLRNESNRLLALKKHGLEEKANRVHNIGVLRDSLKKAQELKDNDIEAYRNHLNTVRQYIIENNTYPNSAVKSAKSRINK